MVPNFNPYLMQNYQNMQAQQPQSPFITVRSEAEARNYPVAYGNSVTFKDETNPYVYCKTVYSQFDKPTFEKYRLVKEDIEEEEPKKECGCDNLKKQMLEIQTDISSIWKELDYLKERKKGKNDEHAGNNK